MRIIISIIQSPARITVYLSVQLKGNIFRTLGQVLATFWQTISTNVSRKNIDTLFMECFSETLYFTLKCYLQLKVTFT